MKCDYRYELSPKGRLAIVTLTTQKYGKAVFKNAQREVPTPCINIAQMPFLGLRRLR